MLTAVLAMSIAAAEQVNLKGTLADAACKAQDAAAR